MKNPLSIEAFADWCEKQPADRGYNYAAPSNCAAAQYLKSVGVLRYRLRSYELPDGWNACLNPFDGGECTFGALAKRLRAASHA